GLHAEFYRFLDRNGAVIPPPAAAKVGALSAGDTAQLVLPRAPDTPQLGYVVHEGGTGAVSEIITTPIISTENGEVIAALGLGFKPFAAPAAGLLRGLWLRGRLHLVAAGPAAAITDVLRSQPAAKGARVAIDGVPHLLFHQQLNLGSLYAPAVEVSAYPLTEFLARQRQLRWRILGAGAALLLGGFGVSRVLAARL
ncbi:MAG: hypothetical protein CFE26_22985, partial [Verrucomicrobiales bacterium VVV1]